MGASCDIYLHCCFIQISICFLCTPRSGLNVGSVLLAQHPFRSFKKSLFIHCHSSTCTCKFRILSAVYAHDTSALYHGEHQKSESSSFVLIMHTSNRFADRIPCTMSDPGLIPAVIQDAGELWVVGGNVGHDELHAMEPFELHAHPECQHIGRFASLWNRMPRSSRGMRGAVRAPAMNATGTPGASGECACAHRSRSEDGEARVPSEEQHVSPRSIQAIF